MAWNLSLLPTRLLSGPLIDIYVGEDARHWALHRNLLCYHSDFFEKPCVTDSKAKNSKIELLNDDPRAFELLVKWLYQGRLDDVADMPSDKKWEYADTCQRLYILCDRMNLPQLKNHAIDQFRRGCFGAGLVPGPEEMKPIYESTPRSSPFRKVQEAFHIPLYHPRSHNLCFWGKRKDFAFRIDRKSETNH